MPKWCGLSKEMWTNKDLREKNQRLISDMEWDVHQWLWEQRKFINTGLEDKLSIAGNIIERKH